MPDRLDAFADILRHLGVVFVRVAAEQSAAHGTFGKQDLYTLAMLGVRGPSRMGEIADHLGVVRGAVTPLVDRLEAAGVVQRRQSETDRRVWRVELTDAGRAVVDAEAVAYRAVAREMLAPLDDAEQATLVALLDRVRVPALT